jgi:hypothetical protein
MIILVRRVRVRPTVIFQGRVLDEAPAAQPTTSASNVVPSQAAPAKRPATSASSPSLVDRVRTFIQKLWTPGS